MTGTVNGSGSAAYALFEHKNDKSNPHNVKADQIMMIKDDDTEENLQSVIRQLRDYVDEQEAVSKAIDTVPSQYGTLTYTGSEQTVTLSGFDASKMTKLAQSVESATNAGPYKILIQPKPGYYWADNGRNEIREVTWTIQPQALASEPTLSTPATDLVYTGETITPTWTGINPSIMVVSGATSGTNAGPYTMTIALSENYCWSDGHTGNKDFVWAITPQLVSAVPSQSGTLTFNGSAQSPTWTGFDADIMTATGTQSASGAGAYPVTFTLAENYGWPDGSTAPKEVSWTINKAPCMASLSKTTMALVTGALTDTIEVTRTGDGMITASSSNSAAAAVTVSGNTVTVTGKAKGTATITVSVAEGTNHVAPSNLSCSVTVTIISTNPADNGPSEIQAAAKSGNAHLIWKVGDAFSVPVSGTVAGTSLSGTFKAFILGFNHNASREGNKRIHFMVGKNASGTDIAFCDNKYSGGIAKNQNGFCMNPGDNTNNYGGNAGGWRDTYMRNTVMPQMLAGFSAEWRNIIVECTKYTSNGNIGQHNSAAEVTATSDKLFLLAEYEIFGTRSYANQYEANYQQQYDYFKNGNSKIANNHTNPGSAVGWWERSPYSGTSNAFCLVGTAGGATGNNACISYGLRPAFAVA